MTSSRTKKGKVLANQGELLNVFVAFDAGVLTSAQAIIKTGLSRSSFFRYVKAWRDTGKLPTSHGNLNRMPVNKLDPTLEARIKELAETKFAGMQPTMLSRCLKKYEGISISVETARRILHELHPEQSSRERRSASHSLRRRRTTCGELVQIDGSPHHWFGEDRPPACLIAFIDDATGRIMAAGFFETESVEGYFTLLIRYISRHGIPVALYSDRHSIFKVVGEHHEENDTTTQYQRACKALARILHEPALRRDRRGAKAPLRRFSLLKFARNAENPNFGRNSPLTPESESGTLSMFLRRSDGPKPRNVLMLQTAQIEMDLHFAFEFDQQRRDADKSVPKARQSRASPA